MAAGSIAFKKIRFTNPYGAISRRFAREAKATPRMEAKFVKVRARSIMRKAPKRPKTPYGNIQWWKRGKKYGQFYWRKGLHSRPGHPPFHNGQKFNLRRIHVVPIKYTSIPKASSAGGVTTAYKVGPEHFGGDPPVPGLHEHGGTLRLNNAQPTYTRKGITLRRRDTRVAKYPPRPYMRPASKEARESAARKSPYTFRRITRLGGLKGRRIY